MNGMTMRAFAVAAMAVAAISPAWGVSRATKAPALDGRLDEADWSAAKWETGFRRFAGPGRQDREPPAQTEFALLADDENLYVGIRAHHPRMDEMKGLGDRSVWQAEGVEFYFCPGGNTFDFYQFLITYQGLTYAMFYSENGNIRPDPYGPAWEMKSADCDGGWTAEARIPLSAFYMTRDADWKGEWKMNVGRSYLDKAGQCFNCWIDGKGYRDFPNFRTVAGFPKRKAAEDVWVRFAEPAVKGPKDGGLAGTVKLGIYAAEPGEVTVRTSFSAPVRANLGRMKVTEVEVPALFPENGRLPMEVRVERPGCTCVRTYPVLVDYQPIRVRLASPSFRGNFYPGQDSDRVAGTVVSAVEGPVVLELDYPSANGRTRRSASLPAGGGTFALETRGFQVGDATLTVRAGSDTFVRKIRKLAPLDNGRHVSWVENGTLIVDGKPVFRRNMYAEYYRGGEAFKRRYDADDLHQTKWLKAIGTLEPDRLIKGIETKEAIRDVKPCPELFAKIDALIDRQFATSTGSFYYICDEPECRNISPVYLRHIYEHVCEKDPYHVLLSCSRSGEKYINCADWFETHPYVNAHYDEKGERVYGRTFAEIGDFVSAFHPEAHPDKCIGGTPTCFSYGGAAGDHPTFREYLANVWCEFLRGAKTMYPYAYHDLGDRAALYEGTRYIFSSMEALDDLILRGERKTLLKTESCECALWTKPDGERLFAIQNFTDRPISVRVPGLSGSFAEFRGTRTFDGASALALEPLESLVGTSRARGAGLPTFAATQARIDALEAERTGRDNQLLCPYPDALGKNPEFEVTSSIRSSGKRKMFDGTRDVVAWNDNWGKDKFYEMSFPKSVPAFSEIVVYGHNIAGMRVRVREGDGLRTLEPAGVEKDEFRLRYTFAKRITSDRIRLEFPANHVELYEIELPKPVRSAGTAPFKEGDRVMFLGDSITHGGWYVAYLQYFWQLRNPGKRITFLNGGICGHTAKSGLDRFDWDIAPEKPNRVFIMFGMNDVSRGNVWNPASTGAKAQESRRRVVEDYRGNMRALIAKCRGIGAEVTLITPTPYDEYSRLIAKPASRGVNDPGLRTLAAATRELAEEENTGLVEFYDVLTPILRDHPAVGFLSDRVHPHDDGHLLMAALVMEAAGFPGTVGETEFDAAGGARTFAYSPKALPLPANANYRSDDRFYPLTERFNREVVRIKGLPKGVYRLKAAGREIGILNAAELAKGVNIATLDTPSQRRSDEGLGKLAAPLKKLAGNLRGLPQGYIQIVKRGGDINNQESAFAKLDEWLEELRVANLENGHYYRYYGGEIKAFKKLYPIRDAEKARLENLRQDIRDWCRPEPFEIAVEPLAQATLAADGAGAFKVAKETADGRYFCEYVPKAIELPTAEESRKAGFGAILKGLGAEPVRVSGLPDGAYNLWLGDVAFGEFSAKEFADGVDIGRMATHSQRAVMSPSLALAERKRAAGERGTVRAEPYVIRVEKVRVAKDVPKLDGKDRAQLKDLIETQVFGKRPVERPPLEQFVQISPDEAVCGGLGVKRRMKAVLGDGSGKSLEVRFTAYIPAAKGPHPAFILVAPHDPDRIAERVSATRPHRMPVRELLERGYAGISYKNNDCALDGEGKLMTNGVWTVFGPSGKDRTKTSWGAISAWAWGASRVLDWVETCPELDAKRVAVVGLSRCGKTALWAGASDERFALTISCCSGCGGAKLNRSGLPASEHFEHLKACQPHWFCRNFYSWSGREDRAPFDMHEIVAMCAPRLVLIASATEDNWAGPSGEFMSGVLASPAWERAGLRGLVAPNGYPPPATPLQEGSIAYHRRIGKHDQTSYDWQRYMDFADSHGWKR